MHIYIKGMFESCKCAKNVPSDARDYQMTRWELKHSWRVGLLFGNYFILTVKHFLCIPFFPTYLFIYDDTKSLMMRKNQRNVQSVTQSTSNEIQR